MIVGWGLRTSQIAWKYQVHINNIELLPTGIIPIRESMSFSVHFFGKCEIKVLFKFCSYVNVPTYYNILR